MIEIAHLLRLADAYQSATALEDVTLSHRIFGDSKKLAALRAGADITVTRFNNALLWFSANWPNPVEWPADVVRPDSPVAAETDDAPQDCLGGVGPEAASASSSSISPLSEVA